LKRHVEREAHSSAVADAKKADRQVRLSDMRCPPRANATLDEGGSLVVQVYHRT